MSKQNLVTFAMLVKNKQANKHINMRHDQRITMNSHKQAVRTIKQVVLKHLLQVYKC